ncbi:hypothetical protein FRB94_009806 [Tulasnella sp. JGI-2019a]|nr:hypothetical protein FRB94_009806 [Tulasnella sp. JGI-2019a]
MKVRTNYSSKASHTFSLLQSLLPYIALMYENPSSYTRPPTAPAAIVSADSSSVLKHTNPTSIISPATTLTTQVATSTDRGRSVGPLSRGIIAAAVIIALIIASYYCC